MFDKYSPIINTGPSRIDATITEKRAPTDESVRLLREMEKAAQNQVMKAVRVENTVFDGVLHHMDDLMSDKGLYVCVFKLNGKQMTARFEINNIEKDREKIAFGVRDAIAREIANAIAESVLHAMKP